jgi:archaellum component FlaC
MILWDRIRKNAEEGLESIKKGASIVAERARIEASLAKILLESGRLEKRLKTLYQKVGERIYTLTAKKERNILKDSEITEVLEEISRLKEDLDKLQRDARLISSGEVEDRRE